MLSRVEQVEQLCAVLRSISQSAARQEVEQELRRILESESFAASNRSCKFLQHAVDKALAGEFEALKERVLGVELFGRQSSFDTDQDSVVRVAASDVRKRLKDYYRTHPDSHVRIDIPSGIYIPQVEISAETPEKLPPEPTASEPVAAPVAQRIPWNAIAAVSVLLSAAVLLTWVVARSGVRGTPAIQPWASMLKAGKSLDIVPADANLVIAKVRSQADIPIEKYNDHAFSYAGDLTGALGAYLNYIPLTTVADAVISARVAELAMRAGAHTQVRACNRVDLSELKSDVPVVLLGSPTSNPWTQLFYDQLDFQVIHRFEDGFDICVNRHPRNGEQATYVPTLRRQGFSEGYAIITMVPNLTGKAPVLIIAGTSTEGTEAAGDFVTNLERLSESMTRLRISPSNRMELLIRTSFVSSASASAEIVAWR